MKNMPPWIWIAFAVVYWISPIDIVPDLFVGVGWLDDLVFAYFSYQKFCEARQANSVRGPMPPPRLRPTQVEAYDVGNGVVIDAEVIEETPRARQWS